MDLLKAAGFFDAGQNGYYLLVLVFMALLVGLYLWGNARKEKKEQKEDPSVTYAQLDEDKLAAVEDDRLVNAVAANLMAKLDKRHPDAYATIPLLSHGRCMVYSVWLLCNELDQAGFEELFASPSGEFTELAANALSELGAPRCAEALRRAMAVQSPDELSELHADFLEGVEAEQPLSLCRDYIRDNPGEFVDREEEPHYKTLDI